MHPEMIKAINKTINKFFIALPLMIYGMISLNSLEK
jgi:hypothetical protein